jgi:hypothetical protein
MNQTLLSKEDVMILDLLERVKKKENTLIEESRKRDLIRETQLEDFSSEKRRFLVKLLIQNTELKLACKEERIIANYVMERFFQTKTLDITKEKFPRNTDMTSEVVKVKLPNIPEEQLLQQEIATFQQKVRKNRPVERKSKNR